MAMPFDIKLLVVPERLSMSQRRMFQAGLEAVNRSATAIDPDLGSTTLTIDGRRSDAWDRVVQDAPRDASWRRLPPAQRVSVWWSLGERLFDGPGRYQLVLKLGEHESVAEVEVTP
jgi:acyl-CoA reductase-like NAD-dependent aldehyde dehydrogenase